ncbi:hypothetical protein B9479_004110 [Cryptococcus floricola]|uniref:DH domain-containing protein n=1 Tax=Cryptococcus floricola TaxID=2591691 RepID=A0A5D3AZ78_9TREE|nr:hypothetical protein B9479_004110 [Cryptococcus floricola]
MAPFPSPAKPRPISRHLSAEPLPPPLPPKAIDLNSSTRSTDKETGSKVTRRAFLCDVVVEKQGEETANLLAHLGEPLQPLSTLPAPDTSSKSSPTTPSRLSRPPDADDEEREDAVPAWTAAKRHEMEKRLENLIDELVRTEKSYYSRIHALKTAYADRLRLYSKDPNQALIPPYEAKAMFANIEAIVPACHSFYTDLCEMLAAGRAEDTVGDVCLKHFKTLRTFDPYRTYLSKQDESQKLFQESLKKFSGFASFIESTKYQTTGIGNIGLRELLMEPVQRIPRYTLLWQTMIKSMSPLSTQRAKLLEAIAIASRIARCEPDPQTVRATVMYNLERNIDDFPAKLFSNNRDYIDAIDVEDNPAEYPTMQSPNGRPLSTMSRGSMSTASTPSMPGFGSLPNSSQIPQSPQFSNSATPPLHCTLFLFDDKLMIVKRQSSSISGRKVTGTDDVQRLVKSGGGIAVKEKNNGKRDKLSFKGEVDVLDVMASDVGNGDFHLFFEHPPVDQSGRWSGRAFRSYSTVHPPYSVSLDPIATKRDKMRFIHNLWAAQALARAKILPSTENRAVPKVLQSEQEEAFEGAQLERARCFWDVWDRSTWGGQRLAKVVVHVDEDGEAPELLLDPRRQELSFYLQPMAGGLCRYAHSVPGEEEEERAVIEMSEVRAKIASTIHEHGIFKFRTGTTSCPTTPSTGTHRYRPSMLNLDTISRNLFGASSVSGRSGTSSDMFSTSSSKRGSRPAMSRSSTLETSLCSMEGPEEKEKEKEPSKKRFSKMPASPESNGLIAGAPYPSGVEKFGQSEKDLNSRLDVARQNSHSASLSPRPSSTSMKTAKLGSKSVAELRRSHEELAEKPLARANTSRTPSPLPHLSPTPATGRTPSPRRPLSSETDATPQARPLPTPKPSLAVNTAPLVIRKTPSRTQTLRSEGSMASPHRVPSPAPNGATLSSQPSLSRPSGPRGPAPRSPQPHPPPLATASSASSSVSTGSTPSAIGSGHTRLRIVSGNGRRISLNRETIPLKGDEENTSPATNTPTSHNLPLAIKRQHSADCLSPRKRSPSLNKSPLLETPLQPLVIRRTSAQRSGASTPRRTSGLANSRTVSASQHSITSVASADTVNTVATTSAEDIEMKEHEDVVSAVDATLKKIHDARGSTKRLKSEMSSLRKQMVKDTVKSKESLSVKMDRQGSLPRSPHKRNMSRIADHDINDPSLHRQPSQSKKEMDTIVMDECARGIVQIVQRVDGHLRQAETDAGQAAQLARKVMGENDEKTREMVSMSNQLHRSREHNELLQRQLGDSQIELDVVYEAFNTELDGMFNDAQLPETEAFQALRNDLQVTKANRNVLQLENQKLKRELEEANLKREQWARILRTQGFNV